MKNAKFLLTIATTLMIFLITDTATGASISALEIILEDNTKTLNLSFKTKGLGDIAIKIKDRKQATIFTQKINSGSSFNKKFVLEDLAEGDYFLSIEDEFRITTQPLKINTKNLEVDRAFRTVLFKPQLILNNENRLLDINWLMSIKGDFELSIEDNLKGTFFTNKITNEKVIHKRYDVSKLPKGKYYVSMKNSKYTYYKLIHLD